MNRSPLGELVVLDDIGPPRRSRLYRAPPASLLLLLPAAVIVGALVLWPVLRVVRASLTGMPAGESRFAHFTTALSAQDAGSVGLRTLLWALVVPAAVTTLGYLVAVLSRRVREGSLIRWILVTPIAIPLVVTGVTFRLLYDPDPDRGLATWFLAFLLRRPAENAPALLGPELITAALMSAFVWAWVGLAVAVFRNALDAIPSGLTDVVRVYGRSRWELFLDAQWQPLLRRTVALVFALVAVGTARTFDLILVMAPGSVRDEAAVLASRVWETAAAGATGPSAALGVLWLLAVLVGMFLAALGIRQPWPAPPRSTPPPAGPAPATPPTPKSRLRMVARLAAVTVAVAWLIPLVGLVATALHDKVDGATGGWWNGRLTLDSFRTVVTDTDLRRGMWLTAVLATAVVVVVLVTAVLAAYPLARLTGAAAQVAGLLLIATAIVPVQVIAAPLTEVLGMAGLAGTAWGLWLVHIALHVPLAVLVLRNAFSDLPTLKIRPLGPRARARALWEYVQPARPAVVAVAVLVFVQVWNDLVIGVLFAGPDMVPLGRLLYGQTRQFVGNSSALAAASVIAAVLPVLLVILSRRELVAGLVSGRTR